MIKQLVEFTCPDCGEEWLLLTVETKDDLKPWMGNFEIDPPTCDCGHEFTETEVLKEN